MGPKQAPSEKLRPPRTLPEGHLRNLNHVLRNPEQTFMTLIRILIVPLMSARSGNLCSHDHHNLKQREIEITGNEPFSY